LGKLGMVIFGSTVLNRIVKFPGGPFPESMIGQLLDVRITQAMPHSLRGEAILL
jgi:tRNA-2-methylthio-N6-dimethylallyladenosine synthase